MPLTKLNVLIVHAHHEPKSFCNALFRHAVQTLSDAGHAVVTSDLYAQRFDPVSDRRNFTSVFDADYLKQGTEERHATAVDGFAPDLECEIRKLESCDLLVFSFPLWWFAMPAILKGWVDRTFAYSRIFGGTRMYENGLGQGRRRPLVVERAVPLGETEVYRHQSVQAVDGEIGQVEGFVVDPADHRVTHVLLREGHMWGRKEVAIPVSSVVAVDEGIRLNITKEQVGNLPPPA